MKILILEDEAAKQQQIQYVIENIDPTFEITACCTFNKFFKEAERNEYHLIIVDLIAPQFDDDAEPVDLSVQIIDATRDHTSINFRTPVIAITQYDDAADENFKSLNGKDIAVITYSDDNDTKWRDTLKNKVEASIPPTTYDFVIVCALEKEANGFIDAGYELGPSRATQGLQCRDITIEDKNGVIVTLPRMGLVTCSIITSRVIELFSPRLICMSGICAGIEKKADIYDVIIPQSCHQHDAGKWGDDGFQSETYTVQISNELHGRITEIIGDSDFSSIIEDLRPKRSEIPEHLESVSLNISLAACSSGSAVIANTDMVSVVREQHRKATAFEMESYALYEAARLSDKSPLFFSAKSVVDDGSENKGDHFHKFACVISARVVYELIKRGVMG